MRGFCRADNSHSKIRGYLPRQSLPQILHLFLSPLLSCGETINKGEGGQVGLLGTPFLQLGCLVCVSFRCVFRAHLLPWVESKQRWALSHGPRRKDLLMFAEHPECTTGETAQCGLLLLPRRQHAECRTQNAERRMQNAERRVQNAERRTQNAECRTQNAYLECLCFLIHIHCRCHSDSSISL